MFIYKDEALFLYKKKRSRSWFSPIEQCNTKIFIIITFWVFQVYEKESQNEEDDLNKREKIY